MTLRVAPEAAEELEAARAFYEGRRPGLGDAFVNSIDALFAQIHDTPLLFALLPDSIDLRRAPLGRFPYVVIYLVHARTVHVVAVAHARRRPGYWADRAPANESNE